MVDPRKKETTNMAKQFTVISGNKVDKAPTDVSPEEIFRYRQKVVGVVLKDAQRTWAELWRDLQGTVAEGGVILSEAENGCKPKRGWSEFLEGMWLLKHYIDYAQRLSEGKV